MSKALTSTCGSPTATSERSSLPTSNQARGRGPAPGARTVSVSPWATRRGSSRWWMRSTDTASSYAAAGCPEHALSYDHGGRHLVATDDTGRVARLDATTLEPRGPVVTLPGRSVRGVVLGDGGRAVVTATSVSLLRYGGCPSGRGSSSTWRPAPSCARVTPGPTRSRPWPVPGRHPRAFSVDDAATSLSSSSRRDCGARRPCARSTTASSTSASAPMAGSSRQDHPEWGCRPLGRHVQPRPGENARRGVIRHDRGRLPGLTARSSSLLASSRFASGHDPPPVHSTSPARSSGAISRPTSGPTSSPGAISSRSTPVMPETMTNADAQPMASASSTKSHRTLPAGIPSHVGSAELVVHETPFVVLRVVVPERVDLDREPKESSICPHARPALPR